MSGAPIHIQGDRSARTRLMTWNYSAFSTRRPDWSASGEKKSTRALHAPTHQVYFLRAMTTPGACQDHRMRRTLSLLCSVSLLIGGPLIEWSGAVACAAEERFAHPAAPSPLDALASSLSTPETLERFMTRQFRYVEDRWLFHQEDYWQSAEELLVTRRGDCEDYAVFAKAILERNGYTVHLLSAYADRTAHTVAVFQDRGAWAIFDLARLHRAKANESLGRLATRILPEWSSLGVMRQEGTTGLISRKFLQPELSLPIDRTLLSPSARSPSTAPTP